jgi:hypothetical protein
VSRPAAGLGPAVGDRLAHAIDDRDLAILGVDIVGLQLFQHARRRETLGEEVQRQCIVALVDERLRHRGADIGAQPIAIEPDADRVGGNADSDLPGPWATRQ